MSTTSNATTSRTARLLAGLGATIAALVWAPRAAFSIDGGFEGHARDLSVVFVDLPLIVLGGALIPLVTWALTTRWTGRPGGAVLAAVVAYALGVWGLLEWWTPRQHPDPCYGPGI
ncbi:hypothetical protein GCM10010347_21230 [Streptomyces cirratus]|uniref:Integral membrane protein n=1 Tax=Streptomyces cirratus TaxID=68187 RepID=A0ABQ3EWS4_9ACTN|nr:hypothetical protein [Streptomyces cirratus]GHB51232.1 hypothetical protein GCM10010347_21230 [Streptomyces cirratus]